MANTNDSEQSALNTEGQDPPLEDDDNVQKKVDITRNQVREGLDDHSPQGVYARRNTYDMREAYNQKLSAVSAKGAEDASTHQEKEKSEKDLLKEELERGELPRQLSESWRIVDPNSVEGKSFQRSAQSFAAQLYAEVKGGEHLPHHEFKNHDFQKDPVRFLISKDSVPNAWFVRYSAPPIIVFTEGLFFPKAGKKPLIGSPNDFAAILCHEMTHMKMRKVYGNIPNSKMEEGFAYSLPLILMHEKGGKIGLNPERVLDANGRAGLFNVMWEESKGKGSWYEYLDVHPCTSNVHSIVSDTLAYLKKEKGTLSPDVPEVEPYKQHDEPLKTVKSAQHASFVESGLRRHPEYETADCQGKVAILQSVLDGMDVLWDIRVSDLVVEIRKLRHDIKTPDDKKAVHAFANHILRLGERKNNKDDLYRMQKLYMALGGTVSQGLETPPLGRLRRINRTIRDFIDAVGAYDGHDESILLAAKAFNEMLEGTPEKPGEPLFATEEGLGFLNQIDWSQFSYPDEEKIRRAHRRHISVEPSWSVLQKVARTHRDVAKASAYLGIGRDPFVLQAICEHDDLALQLANRMAVRSKGDIFGSMAKISPGPHEGSMTIDNLEFGPNGGITNLHSTDNAGSKDERDKIYANYISGWSEREFLEASHDEAAKERLQKVTEANMENRSNLLCLDVCEHNFSLFLELNSSALSGDRKAVSAFLSRMQDVGERGKALLREFFTSEKGHVIIHQSLSGGGGGEWAMPFVGKQILTRSGSVLKKPILTTNPWFKFFLSDENDVFTDEEKFAVTEKILMTDEAHTYMKERSPSEFESIAVTLDKDEAKLYIDRLAPLFAKVKKQYNLEPRTWPQLLGCFKQADGNAGIKSLVQSSLFCEAILLLQDAVPTLAQAADFVEQASAELIASCLFQRDFRNRLKPKAKKYAQAGANTEKVEEAARRWKSLSKAELFVPDVSDEILQTLVARVEAMQNGGKDESERCLNVCEKLLGGARVQDPKLRMRLIEVWTESLRRLHGPDRGEVPYEEKLLATTDRMRMTVSHVDHAEVLSALAKKVQSQNHLSRELQKRAYATTEKAFTQSALHGIFADATIDNIRRSAEHRKATLDFLTSPLTDETCERFLESGQDVLEFIDNTNDATGSFTLSGNEKETIEEGDASLYAYRRQLALRYVRYFHENFWSSPIEIRAVLVRELLISEEKIIDDVDTETFDYTVSKVFTGKGLYEEETRFLLRAYIDALPHYQKHLCLGAMMAAAEKKGTSEMRLGEALAFFLENMGPAETKFGQAAQSHPLVPSDIREDLKRLKYRASEPARWEVTEWVEDIRPELEREYSASKGDAVKIDYIGDVAGSGSMYVVVEVQMTDGNAYMLSLLRPNIEKRGHAGFETMERMADNLDSNTGHSMTQTVRELIQQGNQRLEVEVNCPLAERQYGFAKEIYGGSGVTIDGIRFKFDSADVIAAGDTFFLMSTVRGDHYIELPENTAEEKDVKKQFAMAILTFELNNKLRGHFDCDRHGGNVKVQPESHSIGHFDFKSMPMHEWSDEGYRQCAHLFLSTLTGNTTAQQFFYDLIEQEKLLREKVLEDGHSLDPLVTELQKGLLTDGEYTELLGKEDFIRVVVSALLGGMHPVMQEALLEGIGNKIPAPFKALYELQIESSLRESFQTGVLAPALQQFLPGHLKEEDIIKIQRSSRS